MGTLVSPELCLMYPEITIHIISRLVVGVSAGWLVQGIVV